jgi:hypothetical protein
MPTKSGRIKLEDVRQGKTIFQPFFDPKQKKMVPKAHLVSFGISYRLMGLVANEDGILEGYSLPMYSVSKPSAMSHSKTPSLLTFHPTRNFAVVELPDGSLCLRNGFTSRRRCQQYLEDLEAGRIDEKTHGIVVGSPTREAVEKHAKLGGDLPDPIEFNDLKWEPTRGSTPDYSGRQAG